MEEIILCFKYSEEFFIKNTKTIDSFLKFNLIKKEISCVKCDNRMMIIVTATYIDGYAYICSSKACRSKASLRKGSKMASLNIEFVKILRGMYCWVYGYTLARGIDFCDCSKNTYIKIKDLILQVFSKQEPEMVKIGGEGIGVQFTKLLFVMGS
ncbi:hypothetical protein NCER_102224 [Vairimorpha ceranae BRL01]|uniref:Uncharacterized protein n=1 Tax=Vairimorpha ceranae (strain BRL01) TaxID=578460 RepID=C4VBN6_VAIC1|nr:hypothetical protein NCER_102224 [Vairimorpha ceranae BRL01]